MDLERLKNKLTTNNKPMENYEITLLTSQGMKVEVYNTSLSLEEFTAQMIEKYGTFITYQSKQI
jgi:hypothetical protein